MKKFLIILCLLVCLGYFFIFKIKPTSHQTFIKNDLTVLPFHTLSTQSFTYTKNFIGSVQAIQSVAIVPYLSGFLKEVRVHSGEEVKKGDVLFLLDERIPLANLEQAQEAVSQSYASRANAENYYQRMTETSSKAISPTELEQAKTEFEAADAVYQKALAAQNQAKTLYDYTIIQAPISGWVGNITATVGEYLSPESKTLATIISFSPIRLAFSVPMSNYQGHFSSDNATLQVLLTSGQMLEFKNFNVVQNNQADRTTDSLSFFIDVQNTEKLLIPEAYVEIRFLYPKTGILVDKNWLTLTTNGAQAHILADGIIEKRAVQIAAPIGNQYWIQSGLKEGDHIITVPVSSHQIGQIAEGIEQ